MSEKKPDIRNIKSLTTSKIIDLFLDGKISKDDLKKFIEKDDIFKLDRLNLEKVLYTQKNEKSRFPKELRISLSDISDAYGRILTGDDIYNLARAGLVNEAFLLKMLKRSKVMVALEKVEKCTAQENLGDSQPNVESKPARKRKDNDKSPAKEQERVADDDKTSSRDVSNTGAEEEQPVEEQPVEEQLVEEQPVEEQLIEEQPVEEQPIEDIGAGEFVIGEENGDLSHVVDTEGIESDGSTQESVLTNKKVRNFFTATRLLRMFLEQRMSAEFVDDFKELFKDNVMYRIEVSKRLIESLKKIFKDNIPVISSIIMRLYFKGMILIDDLKRLLEDEIFKNSIFKEYTICDILDENGRVIYTYRTKDKTNEDNSTGLTVEEDNEIPRVVLQSLLPLPGEIIEEASSDVNSIIDPETEDFEDSMQKSIPYLTIGPLEDDELLSEYNHGNVDPSIMQIMSLEERCPINNVANFLLIDKKQRAARVKEEFMKRNIYVEHIMELFFEYDGLTAEELKFIIKDLPKSVAIINYINEKTSFEQIRDLYKCKLISFRVLDLLKIRGYISLEEFEQIRRMVNKEEFYLSIAETTFYTRKEDMPKEPVESKVVDASAEVLAVPEASSDLILDSDGKEHMGTNLLAKPVDKTAVVEIFDSERVLLTRVLGISPEEIAKISLINSKDNNGEPTTLDGYQIIGNRADGLVIFGKFDYKSPIFVMSYEEAVYFLRSRDDENKNYIVDDLIFVERLEGNEQIRVVEHDENMGKNIVQAVCDLSESARTRYSNDEQYRSDVSKFVKTLDEHYNDDRELYSGVVTEEN